MKPIENYESIDTAEVTRKYMPNQGWAGVVRCEGVEDHGDKNYLSLTWDVAEGEFKDYFKNDSFYEDKPWAHSLILSYSERGKQQFKAAMEAIAKSNPGWNWAWDEFALIGRAFGLVLGAEEYVSTRGEVKTRLRRFGKVIPIEDVRSGNYTIPKIKPLSPADKAKLDALSAAVSPSSTGTAAPAAFDPFADIPFN